MVTLTDSSYDMLRAAVNAARQFQCRSIKVLKKRLLMTFPGHEVKNNDALARACGRSQAQMSNLFRVNATNGIGVSLARACEQKLGLPHGSLDADVNDIEVTQQKFF